MGLKWEILFYTGFFEPFFSFGRLVEGQTLSCEANSAVQLRMSTFSFADFNHMNTSLSLEKVGTATAAAATIIWDNTAWEINSKTGTPDKLKTAVSALYGLAWNRAVLTAAIAARICRVLALMRSPIFPRKEYGRPALFVKKAYYASRDFPPELLEWGAIARQLRLELEHCWPEILAMATFFLAQGVRCPGKLARLAAPDLQPMFESPPAAAALRTMWAALRADASISVAPDQPLPAHAVFAQDPLAKASRAHSALFQRSGQLVLRTPRRAHLPRHFRKLGPAQRIEVLRPSALSPLILDRFIFGATGANLLKQVRGSLPRMASAFRCYAVFFELRHAPAPASPPLFRMRMKSPPDGARLPTSPPPTGARFHTFGNVASPSASTPVG